MLVFEHVTGLSKKFHLKDVSFSLDKGYMLGIAGKNGAGKTTLFRYILKENIPYQGTIYLNGTDIRKNHAKSLNEIGFVSDENIFLNDYTARQNAQMLGKFYSNWEDERFSFLMKKMNLSENKILGKMSRGEFSKFQMAFAMAHHAKLYLLDEVTGGMDVIFRKEFFQILREELATEEASIILTTHIEEELELKMDYVGILERGELKSFQEAGGNL